MNKEDILKDFDKEFKPTSNCSRCWGDNYDEKCTCDSDISNQEYMNKGFKQFLIKALAKRDKEIIQILEGMKVEELEPEWDTCDWMKNSARNEAIKEAISKIKKLNWEEPKLVKCPKCERTLYVKKELLNKKIECPLCEELVIYEIKEL